MSGHSKWSQIKRQKGAADVKRGAVFSKLTNAIIIASKNGPDLNANFSLKMAVDKARAANMPKENIDRAIKRGTGELAGQSIEEAIYEAIGPFNTSIIIQTATDNKNRTSASIKNVLNKNNGKLASTGSVTYQFKRMGKLILDISSKNLEELELVAIDAGAEDIDEVQDEGALSIYTNPAQLNQVKNNLEKQGIKINDQSLSWEPINLVRIENREDAEKIIKLMEELEAIEDVVAVYSNFDLSKEAL